MPALPPFVQLVSARTGLAPNVVAAWTRAEGGPAGNPLNIGPGRNYGTTQAAAEAVARLINTSGYYAGIRQAIQRGNPAGEIAAIKQSPWDAGHYANGVLDRTFGSPVPGAIAPAAQTPFAGSVTPPGRPNLGLLLDLNNRMQGLDVPSVANLFPQQAPTVPGAAAMPHAALPASTSTIKSLETFARPFGLTVTSTTGGQHATNSYHYLGRAVDFGGDPKGMAGLAADALAHPQDFKEMFYTGPGHPNFFISGGQVLPLSQLDPHLYQEHRNHVHLAH